MISIDERRSLIQDNLFSGVLHRLYTKNVDQNGGRTKKNVDFITDPTKTFICAYRFSAFSEYRPARSDNI